MNAKIRYAVDFANFCINNNVEPVDVEMLIRLVSSYTKSYVRSNNNRTVDNSNKYMGDIVKMATRLGLEVEFSSMIPSFTKDGKNVFLPK